MRKRQASKLRPGDEIKIRFAKEDTFTPSKWEPGAVASEPIQNEDGVFMSVLLADDTYVMHVKHTMVR